MSNKGVNYLKAKNRSKERLVILSVLLFSCLFASFLNNINIHDNFSKDNRGDVEFQIRDLKTQDLTFNNSYEDIGAPWKVSHWANTTDYDLQVSFGNGTTNTKNIDMGVGWEGYQLNGTIKDLYDERNWVNGTFQCGPDDNTFGTNENDSNDVLNWTFVKDDDTSSFTNDMSGNYYDDGNAVTDYQDCIELRISGGGSGRGYDQGDACYWYTEFDMPRGDIIDGEIRFSVYPETFNGYGNHFVFQVLINDVNVYTRGLLALVEESPDPINGDWLDAIVPLDVYFNNPQVFPEGVKAMNVTLQFKRVGETLDTGSYLTSYRAFADNVSLILKSQVNATQVGLQMNEVSVSDGNEWGNGEVSQISSWTTSPVEIKFNSTEANPPPEMGGYNVEFTTDLTLFARKLNDDSHYQPNFYGTSFEANNDSSVLWESYARVSVPTGYEETNMTIEFPEDVQITWISNAEKPNTNMLQYCDNSTLGLLKVYNFSETPDGFWWVKGESPNYCTELNVYNNVTGSWVLNNTFISGDFINITGKIESGGLDISGYLGNTKAKLQIRFPNGNIWTTENQIKQVDNNGFVYFDPIMIPNNAPDYEAGEYEAIIIWNNSYSSFGINESGIIYKRFNVIHDSILEPDQGIYFIENVIDDRVINIKVSFKDIIDDTAIENALVYTNFAGEDHNFTEISPGFYLFEFNATKANAGNNTLTIYANSTYYLNKIIDVTVEVVKETLLTVESDFITVSWNQNFTVRFNYTEKNNPLIGINTTAINSTWLGESHLIQPYEGQYELTCNTSAYDTLTLQSFIITINPYKYEAQSVLIRVQITELESSLSLYLNGNHTNIGETIRVEVGDLINVTIYYRDNSTQNHLPNATVSLLGSIPILPKELNETNNYYNITINSADLEQGITTLTVFAQLINYKSQTIHFFVEVTEKSTDLQLFLNDDPKTDEKVATLTIGETLNITVKYTDLSGAHITTATIQLIGEGILENFTKDDGLGQFYILLNETDLTIGLNLFSIIARANNYQVQSINPIITVNRIQTQLNMPSQIEADPKDDVLLSVTLEDLYFGGTILNATVTYIWAYGQGELVDHYGNGTYEGTLNNVPEGSYTIRITAFAGPNYDFESRDILLIVSTPETTPSPDLSWLVYVLIGAIVGLVGIFTLYQKTLKYPPLVRKIRKLRKKVRKNQKLKPILVNKRDEIIESAIQDQSNIIESIEPAENNKFQIKKDET
ncbi:MAG: hypothetical protein ACFFBC_05050 [Promethearchaeota archaeon]